MTDDTHPPQKVALVSMPWPIFNRPSLQLATLKSAVEEKSTCQVDCFHPYLHIAKAIGIEAYVRIARSGWAGEALFAPLLFPEMKSQAEKLFRQSLPKKDPAIGDFKNWWTALKKAYPRGLKQLRYTATACSASPSVSFNSSLLCISLQSSKNNIHRCPLSLVAHHAPAR